jgi:enhancing lycopene biosynthesis protein 2
MANVAVVLSGCGYLDGAEIRESVCTLLALDKHDAEVECFAPDKAQMHVVDHISGDETGESRNVLTESARIARGKITQLSKLNPQEFDALVMPGGFGVAKNLSDLAVKGPDAQVDEEFLRVIKEFYSAGKPIGAICISPAVLSAALRGEKIKVTIGEDEGTAQAIEAMGNIHQNAPTDSYVFDEEHNIASCSAYMREDRISKVAAGIEQVVEKVLSQVNRSKKAA